MQPTHASRTYGAPLDADSQNNRKANSRKGGARETAASHRHSTQNDTGSPPE